MQSYWLKLLHIGAYYTVSHKEGSHFYFYDNFDKCNVLMWSDFSNSSTFAFTDILRKSQKQQAPLCMYGNCSFIVVRSNESHL